MPQLPDETVITLARDISSVLDALVPGWTPQRQHDPGITLLQVMAFLGDVVVYRQSSTDLASVAAQVVDRLRALTADCEVSELTRIRYFSGQLLTAGDFNDDQRYHRDKLRRVIRHLHGRGVVSGLEVQVEESSSDRGAVRIEPGAAITPDGELLVVNACRRCDVTLQGEASFVSLVYTEHNTRSVATGDPASLEASRIEEGVGVVLTADPPHDGVAIARLVHGADGWHVDRSFALERA
jgi:hypothetical protein